MSNSDGDTARKRRVHRNTRVDRRGRVGAARDAVKQEVPRYIKWALTNPQITRRHFTEWEWTVLCARYPVYDFTPLRNSSVAVGRILGMTGKSAQVRKAEDVAHQRARELAYLWEPAHRRWTAWKTGEGPRPRK